MSRKILIAIIGCLAMLATACSTTNQGITEPAKNDATSSFSVDALNGNGTFTPAVSVSENDNSAVVTIEAVGADDLVTAALELNYDASKYTPERVEFSDFLGSVENTFNFSMTNQAGVVPVGISQIIDSGVKPVNGSGMLATVYFSSRPFSGDRSSSKAVTGGVNAVNLEISPVDGSNVMLSWDEKNVGDYDNNGEVNVADITPLGINLGKSRTDAANPAEFDVIDGDGNGLITVSDITPIGAYYGNSIIGYSVYLVQGGNETSATPGEVTASRSEFMSPGQKTRPHYEKQVNVSGGVNGVNFLVKPQDSGMNAGIPSNEVGATVIPGAPNAPTNVAGLSDETTGNLTVKVSWTKSDSADVVAYEVERKLTSQDEFAFSVVSSGLGSSASLFNDVRPDQTSVDYRVRAKDSEGLFSAYSSVVTVVPFKTAIPAPLDVTAAPKDGVNAAIEITWKQPPTIVKNYSLYRRTMGETDFVKIFTTQFPLEKSYVDAGLTVGTTYEYVVTTLTNEGESNYSEMVSSVPSEIVILPITITSFTTSKTTHHTSGSEGPANLSVVTDSVPTSVDWNASAGVITGSGANVTWLPTGAAVGKVTINVTVHNGGENDSDSLDLIVTSHAIITKHTDNTAIGKNGTGEWIDFTQPNNKVPSAPYESYGDYIGNGNFVVTLNWWEQWCGPCLAEMPEMFAWSQELGPNGYYHVACSGDYANASNITFLSNKGWVGDYFISFSTDDSNHTQWTLNPSIDEYWPAWNSIPRTLLLDKDGWIRRSYIGTLSGGPASQWKAAAEELMGL
jgi:thiol-disulfide isomerase/thioredoxin